MNEISPSEIWIADDDPLYSPALKSILEEDVDGATVNLFSTGNHVLEALKAGRSPGALVLDMMLPMGEDDATGGLPPPIGKRANGITLVERFEKAGGSPSRILVITALKDERCHSSLVELGIPRGNILSKPARVDEITRLVKQIVSRSRKT